MVVVRTLQRSSSRNTRKNSNSCAARVPFVPDNLEIVEGIGPKIASLLKDAGIEPLSNWLETEVSILEKILDDANLRILPILPVGRNKPPLSCGREKWMNWRLSKPRSKAAEKFNNERHHESKILPAQIWLHADGAIWQNFILMYSGVF